MRGFAAEMRAFIAGELAAGLSAPNSDFGSHRSAAFSRRLGARCLDRDDLAEALWRPRAQHAGRHA
jgi:hypothetical protein